MDLRARSIATALLQRYVPGDRALLLHPEGPERVVAFLGCLCAGATAVPPPSCTPPTKTDAIQRPPLPPRWSGCWPRRPSTSTASRSAGPAPPPPSRRVGPPDAPPFADVDQLLS
ncbi:hypothetical protein D7231_02820 [Streptomyces klenkii]|uniref:AMP-dependent synthetase/ligase domain-containing protein n=1 Tax=Streptomyces klenkii TaxID=1420899 RepID=A0A3B0BXC3_9ACTN|nr:hypothetical protein D7231_02820 [Streptomyces klenkii]